MHSISSETPLYHNNDSVKNTSKVNTLPGTEKVQEFMDTRRRGSKDEEKAAMLMSKKIEIITPIPQEATIEKELTLLINEIALFGEAKEISSFNQVKIGHLTKFIDEVLKKKDIEITKLKNLIDLLPVVRKLDILKFAIANCHVEIIKYFIVHPFQTDTPFIEYFFNIGGYIIEELIQSNCNECTNFLKELLSELSKKHNEKFNESNPDKEMLSVLTSQLCLLLNGMNLMSEVELFTAARKESMLRDALSKGYMHYDWPRKLIEYFIQNPFEASHKNFYSYFTQPWQLALLTLVQKETMLNLAFNNSNNEVIEYFISQPIPLSELFLTQIDIKKLEQFTLEQKESILKKAIEEPSTLSKEIIKYFIQNPFETKNKAFYAFYKAEDLLALRPAQKELLLKAAMNNGDIRIIEHFIANPFNPTKFIQYFLDINLGVLCCLNESNSIYCKIILSEVWSILSKDFVKNFNKTASNKTEIKILVNKLYLFLIVTKEVNRIALFTSEQKELILEEELSPGFHCIELLKYFICNPFESKGKPSFVHFANSSIDNFKMFLTEASAESCVLMSEYLWSQYKDASQTLSSRDNEFAYKIYKVIEHTKMFGAFEDFNDVQKTGVILKAVGNYDYEFVLSVYKLSFGNRALIENVSTHSFLFSGWRHTKAIEFLQSAVVNAKTNLSRTGNDYFWFLARGYFNDGLKTYKILIENGYPVSCQMLEDVLFRFNYPFLDFILDKIDLSFLEANAHAILSNLKISEDPKALEMLLNRHPDLFKTTQLTAQQILELLKEGVKEGRSWFVHLLFKECNVQVGEKQLDEMMAEVTKTGNLRLIKSFCDYAKKNNFQSVNLQYPATIIAEFNKFIAEDSRLKVQVGPNDSIQTLLKKLILNSDLPDVYKLMQQLPGALSASLLMYLDETVRTLALCVPFPNRKLLMRLNPKWKDADVYASDTLKYAAQNRAFIKEMAPQLTNMKRSEALEKIINHRHAHYSGLDPWYKQRVSDQRKDVTQIGDYVFGSNWYTHTPVIVLKMRNNINSIMREDGAIIYAWSLRHLSNLLYDVNDRDWKMPKGVSMYEKNGRIYHYYPYKNQNVPITLITSHNSIISDSLNEVAWFHNPLGKDENGYYYHPVEKLEPHLEGLHRDILSLDQVKPDTRLTIQKHLGELSYLGSTLCEMLRGTPHNSMMLTNLYIENKHLPPMIPRKQAFFYDNACLMMPVEMMRDNFTEAKRREGSPYFEPLLDESLEFDTTVPSELAELKLSCLKDWFSKNGMLLGLCSEEVRSNQELIAIAVKQNSAAQKYACEIASMAKDFYEHKKLT